MINGINYIRMRIPTFKKFGKSTLEEIIGPVINSAPNLLVNSLEHSLFLSNNDNLFERFDLPIDAQLSPSFTATVADMDGDGHEDVFLSQNFFAYQIETSRSDAGRGLWLRGDGSGMLTPIPGHESGVKVYGEQRGAAVADYDGDGRVDLVVSQNGAPTKLFRNINASPGIRMKNIIGQFRIRYNDGTAGPLREAAIGSGYWSQNGNSIIGIEEGAQIIEIRSDGARKNVPLAKLNHHTTE